MAASHDVTQHSAAMWKSSRRASEDNSRNLPGCFSSIVGTLPSLLFSVVGLGLSVLRPLLVDDAGGDLLGPVSIASGLLEFLFQLFVLPFTLRTCASGHIGLPKLSCNPGARDARSA